MSQDHGNKSPPSPAIADLGAPELFQTSNAGAAASMLTASRCYGWLAGPLRWMAMSGTASASSEASPG